MATFLDYLENEKSKVQKKLDWLNRPRFPKRAYSLHDLQESLFCNLLISEYDKIINEYKKQNLVEESIDVDKCFDCMYYADVDGIKFCNKVKGKSIIKPEQVPEWCPYKI